MKYALLFFFCLAAVAVNAQAPHFDAERATSVLIATIPHDVRIKADQYSEGGYWLLLWNFLYAAFIAWLFLFGGLSAMIKKIAEKTGKRGWGDLVYIVLYLSAAFLLTLPLDCYQNFFREKVYGFSNQSFGQWLGADALQFALELIIFSPFLLLIFRLFRRVGESWWLWGSGAAILFIAGLLIIYPVFIAPLFNQYTPLKDGPLKERLLSMARANSAAISQVYGYDESQQTKTFDANVSGFAGTARIALSDNLLRHCSDDEIVAVTGHELGHFVLHHLFILVVAFGLLTVIGCRLVHWLFGRLIRRYGRHWQVSSVGEVTGLPLLVFLFTLYFFVMTPVTNSITRVLEAEADNYGLNAARQPDAIASVFLKTADNHKVAPGFWEEVIFFDHPSREHRILAAMKWKAER